MSFSVAAITVMGIGAVNSAFGARNSAIGTRNALNFQADIAAINARSDELSAQQALITGQRQEQSVRLKGANLKAAQKTSSAANGIDVSASETTNRILASTQFMVESDALTISSNATQAAESFRMKGVNDMNDAAIKRSTAQGIDPNMAMYSSLIGSAGTVAGAWYMQNKGYQSRTNGMGS
jgi:hypothetical protein